MNHISGTILQGVADLKEEIRLKSSIVMNHGNDQKESFDFSVKNF
jgi:hypothetical protein